MDKKNVSPLHPAPGQTVLLMGGPYDGQDIRATGEEMKLGIIGRDVQKDGRRQESRKALRMPRFGWIEEMKMIYLPLATFSYGL